MAVLIDSSVWISAAKEQNIECFLLKQLIKQNQHIYITDIIQTEVCQGARTEEEFVKLWHFLLGFSFLEVTKGHWAKCSWNYYSCKKKGITMSTIDCLIATLAYEYQLPLWSIDNDLIRISSIIGFTLYQPEN